MSDGGKLGVMENRPNMAPVGAATPSTATSATAPVMPDGAMTTPSNKHLQIKVRNPRDLFSILPYALGYQPEESILVICLREQGGLGMIARTSLVDLEDNKCCVELSKMVAHSAAADNTGRAFVVVYCRATDEFTLHGYKKQAKQFAHALKPIPVETWIINSEVFYRIDCEEHGCCPPGGFPVSDLAETEASAALVYRGYAPSRNRDDYLRLPQPAPGNVEAANLAASRFASEKRRNTAPITWRQKAFITWQNAVELTAQDKAIPPKVLGVLGAALTDTTMRDAVLLSCLPDGAITANEIIENAKAAHQTAADLMARVVGDDELVPIAPDHQLIRNAAIVLEAVAAHATELRQPGPLTLLAFLAWWGGDGTRANARVRQALAITKDYQLASTLAAAIENRLLPGWIRQRGSSGSGASGRGASAPLAVGAASGEAKPAPAQAAA